MAADVPDGGPEQGEGDGRGRDQAAGDLPLVDRAGPAVPGRAHRGRAAAPKNTEAVDLLRAVRTVARGEGIAAPAVTRRLIAEFAAAPARAGGADPAVPEGLTPREREVLGRVGEGLSDAELADRPDMAEGTVKTHVSRLPAKPGLRSRVQAAVPARELGR